MKGGRQPHGYTIVEALIFLAITSVMFVLVVRTIGGQQEKAEFTNAIRDIDSQLQDIANDVSTGYYPAPKNFRCTVSANKPQLSPGASEQGSNEDCTFIGRVIKFDKGTSDGQPYHIMSVVGARRFNGSDVTDMTHAAPTVLHITGSGYTDQMENQVLPIAATVKSIRYINGGSPSGVSAFGFFTTFSTVAATGGLQSGSRGVNLIPIPTATPGNELAEDISTTGSKIEALDSSSVVNPDGGIIVCLESSGGNQHAEITLGGQSSNSSTKTEIKPGACT